MGDLIKPGCYGPSLYRFINSDSNSFSECFKKGLYFMKLDLQCLFPFNLNGYCKQCEFNDLPVF